MSDATEQGTEAKAAPAGKPQKATEYVVLVGDPSDSWAIAGTYAGVTQLDAIKKAVAANSGRPDEANAEWVAVPARSWKPLKRKVEQVVKESWS